MIARFPDEGVDSKLEVKKCILKNMPSDMCNERERFQHE